MVTNVHDKNIFKKSKSNNKNVRSWPKGFFKTNYFPLNQSTMPSISKI